jgi:hypothetical protein
VGERKRNKLWEREKLWEGERRKLLFFKKKKKPTDWATPNGLD